MALTSSQKEDSRDAQGAWKVRALDGLLEIHTTATPLRSATGRIHKLQALRLRHEDLGKSDSLASSDANAKWRAKINAHVSINPNHKHVLKTVS